MSRTKKNKKPVGFDFWSRRGKAGGVLGYGPVAKEITRDKERTRDKEIERAALDDPENGAPGRIPGE